jgi:hypothetical protein
MKKRFSIVLLAMLMLTVPLAVSEAFNLGGITINLPGSGSNNSGNGSSSSSAKVNTPNLADHPTKIEVTLNSPMGYDEHSKYMIKGTVRFDDKPGMKVPEYTEVYITPKNSYLEGNVFHGGYYGNGHTNSEAQFSVRCKPADYMLLIYVNNYACVAPATPELNGEVHSYVMKRLPDNLKFAK